MNQQAKRIRFWAMRNPKPHKFRVHTGNEKQIVEIVGPRTSWARIAETLEAFEADLIEALTSDDRVIRACKPNELDADASDDNADADPDADGDDNSARAVPALLDPETLRFNEFARHISNAYREAQTQVGLRNEAAFNRMIDLFETLAQQSKDQAHALNVQQATITKLYEQQIKDAFARAQTGEGGGEGGGWIDDLVRPFVQAMQRADGGNAGDDGGDDGAPDDEAAPAAPNGKGH